MDFYKIVGIVLIMMSGVIYTLGRGFSMVSTSIVKAGFEAGRMSGVVPDVTTNGFFSNWFVPLFFVLGVLSLLYGFNRSNKK